MVDGRYIYSIHGVYESTNIIVWAVESATALPGFTHEELKPTETGSYAMRLRDWGWCNKLGYNTNSSMILIYKK